MKSRLLTGLLLLLNACWGFSQVLINEVNLKPQSDAISSQFQSLKVCSQATYGAEYIELYNTTCAPVDIGCWMIGYRIFSASLDGTFRFPVGTTISAHGFISIGGPNSGATFNLYNYCSNPHLVTGADRWYLENGDCYVAFYNANGVPQDAVFWTVSAGQSAKWGTDSDLDEPPSYVPSPAGCPAVGSLPGPLSASLSAVVEYGGASPAMGSVVHRTSDGGAVWANNGVPTVNATNNVADPCVLPVTLQEIRLDCHPEQTSLHWRTALEENMDYFEIQHATNGQQFQALARVDAKGTPGNGAEYKYDFDGTSILQGLVRLRQVDMGGEVSFSPVLELDCENIHDHIMMQNGTLFSKYGLENVFCRIWDLSGRVLYEGNALDCSLDIPVGGCFVIQVVDGKKVSYKKLMNQ